MCVQRDACRGQSGQCQTIRDNVAHGGMNPVCGAGVCCKGVVGVNPVCIRWWTGVNPVVRKAAYSGIEGIVREDGIRGEFTIRKKSLQVERGPHPDWQ